MRIAWFIGGAVFIFIGYTTALFFNYYRWEAPLIKQTYPLTLPRTHIFVDEKHYLLTHLFTRKVNQYTNNEYIFIYPYRPFWYFVLHKKNPIRHTDTSYGILRPHEELYILTELQRKKIDFIITHEKLNTKNKIIEDYIKQNFTPIKSLYEYTLWQKK